MTRRHVAIATIGLGTTLGLAACSGGNTAPKPAMPAVCAEALDQAQILSETQANTYMNAVGTCILSLEGIAPSGDRQQGVDTVTTNTAVAAGRATFTLTDKQSGTSSVGWSITENLISAPSPGNKQQTATQPYYITANFFSGNTSTPAEWLGLVRTPTAHNMTFTDEMGSAIMDTSGMTQKELDFASQGMDNLQTATNTTLKLAETAILHDVSAGA